MLNNVLIVYLILINLLSAGVMWVDKRKAKKNRWRVKERNLFILALIGGAPGIYLGMNLFKHKTKHLKFTLGIPMTLIINIITIYWLTQIF